jgi:hypothetical protein
MIDVNGDRPGHPDDELIEDARMAASSDWEEEFIADIIERRQRFGRAFMLTPKQREKLQQIAHGDDENRFP